MAKGYFLSAHRSEADPIKKAAYNLLARDALEKAGGKVIAMANLIHCFITIGLVFYFYHKLTILGLTYFLIELIIVFGVIIIELKAASELTAGNV